VAESGVVIRLAAVAGTVLGLGIYRRFRRLKGLTSYFCTDCHRFRERPGTTIVPDTHAYHATVSGACAVHRSEIFKLAPTLDPLSGTYQGRSSGHGLPLGWRKLSRAGAISL
jgi:hypothetical protein